MQRGSWIAGSGVSSATCEGIDCNIWAIRSHLVTFLGIQFFRLQNKQPKPFIMNVWLVSSLSCAGSHRKVSSLPRLRDTKDRSYCRLVGLLPKYVMV